ncbi:MAG: XRE family transcriptional regulator, partial [Planctomycetaceae bacterium]
RGEEFWPPVYESGGIKVGAYIVQYEDDSADTHRDALLQTYESAAAKIMPLPTQAIARRMARL